MSPSRGWGPSLTTPSSKMRTPLPPLPSLSTPHLFFTISLSHGTHYFFLNFYFQISISSLEVAKTERSQCAFHPVSLHSYILNNYSIKTREMVLVQCVCIVLCHFITYVDSCNHHHSQQIIPPESPQITPVGDLIVTLYPCPSKPALICFPPDFVNFEVI